MATSAPRTLDPEVADALRGVVSPSGLITQAERLLAYESDALTTRRGFPLAVVFPVDRSELVEAVRVLYRHRIPFVPRGAGTGLAGGAVANGAVLVSTARLDRILSVYPEERIAVVEPGVVTADVSTAAAAYGLRYLPDPGSATACTIGGNVAQNAGGPHCLRHGVTSDHVLSVEVVLPDSSVVTLGRGDDGGLDLAGLFIGSEGTFGIASRITVRLVPTPRSVGTALALFDSLEDSGRAVNEVFRAGVVPVAMELIDRATIRVVEQSVFAAGLPTDAAAALIVECEGDDAGVDADMEVVAGALEGAGAREVSRAADESTRSRMWQARKKAYGALGRLAPDVLVQDAVVPRTRLPDLLPAIEKLANEHALPLANFFHAGDGNLHPNLMFDSMDPDQVERVEEASAAIMRLCVEAGGTITGEHGVGLDKQRYMPLMFDEEELATLRSLKKAFDPDGRCNADKLLPPDPDPWSPRPEVPADRKEADREPAAEIIDYRRDDLTVAAGAGIALDELAAFLEERGQWIPVAPADGRSLEHWLLWADPHASDHAYGPVRRQVLACTVVGADGRTLKCGRPLVKNVAGYDLARLACGSRGRLGRIREATLRLWPLPAERRLLAIRAAGREIELAGALAALRPADHTEPELVLWETDVATGSSNLLVGLHGSRAGVASRHAELERWAESRGASVEALETDGPRSTHAADASLRSESETDRSAWLRCSRRDFAEAAHAGVRLLGRTGVSEARLSGHPLGGVIEFRFQADDDTTSVALFRALEGEFGAGSVRAGPQSASDRAAIEESRSVAVRELEDRVLAALDRRPRDKTGSAG